MFLWNVELSPHINFYGAVKTTAPPLKAEKDTNALIPKKYKSLGIAD